MRLTVAGENAQLGGDLLAGEAPASQAIDRLDNRRRGSAGATDADALWRGRAERADAGGHEHLRAVHGHRPAAQAAVAVLPGHRSFDNLSILGSDRMDNLLKAHS